MRRGTLIARAGLCGALLAGALAASIALAQPPRRPPVPPAPPAKVDAGNGGTDNPYDPNAPAPAPTPSATPAPTTAPPPPPGDGGKLSPLTPLPVEFPEAGPPPQTLDYDRLLADIAALRARVAAVSDNLFQSRIAVTLETSGDHGKIAKLTVSLDDGIVYTAAPNFRASDATAIYEHAVAPGRHSVTLDVERRDDRDDSFRTQQRSRFVVDVPRDHRLELDLRIWDDSTMGDDFPGDRSGRYDLRVRMKANAKPVKR
jgi:hypothetical protein